MLVDDLPDAARVRVIWQTLVHDDRCAVCERAIDDVAVSGHPADIGRAPIDVAVVIIEDVSVRHLREQEIAA